MSQVFNKLEYKKRRQALRHNMPEPEQRMWKILRHEQLGVKFRRQHGIGCYIVDFYCAELKLVIEIDGDSHFVEGAHIKDKIRSDFMSNLGIKTMRLNNQDVMNNLDGVYQTIKQQLDLMMQTPSQPPP